VNNLQVGENGTSASAARCGLRRSPQLRKVPLKLLQACVAAHGPRSPLFRKPQATSLRLRALNAPATGQVQRRGPHKPVCRPPRAEALRLPKPPFQSGQGERLEKSWAVYSPSGPAESASAAAARSNATSRDGRRA
jgi:hypothetical protein